MRALITGAGGFVGGHLAAFLASLNASAAPEQPGIELHGTILNDEQRPALSALGMTLHQVDLCDPEGVRAVLEAVRPDRIYHLAGQAYVPLSFAQPWNTLETNIRAPLNLMQVIHDLGLTETRLLVVGSAEMYGVVSPEQMPLTEMTPFAPASPYSVSKIAQDMLALQFHLSYHLHTVRVRSFNHIGPGQSDRFAVAAFASQIARIELGQAEPVVYVGDLSAERDLTDVRDVVRAYYLALEHGTAGAVYNVCSNLAYPMRTVLDRLISLSVRPVTVQVDPSRLRPIDIPRLLGDYSMLRAQTGWQPTISLEQTLGDILNDWRQRLRSPAVPTKPSHPLGATV
jgi:GDP-4-dehydro-6-deoxy-D-mannose reductase